MAGTNRYTRIKEVLEDSGFEKGDLISIGRLRNLIIRNLGSDEYKTVLPYLQLMRESGMIKETLEGWEIMIKIKSEEEK